MIKVLIVEDDPMVSQLNKRYIESLNDFKVIGQSANGHEALEFCSRNEIDLVILDVYMPKLDGVNFFKEMRKRKIIADVILVTASKEIETVEKALKMGAFDYLIKPFEYERLKKSLMNYIKRYEIINNKDSLKQAELDKIFLGDSGTSDNGLQKGLHRKTLDRVREFMKNNSKYYTSEEIALELSLTKVTIRRYLEYMESTGEVKLEIEYGTIGRPTHLYKYLGVE